MYLLPRTPPYIIVSLVVIFGLLFHPIWYFWWIEEALYRRLSALVLMVICLCLLGYIVWPVTERPAEKPEQATVQEIPSAVAKKIPEPIRPTIPNEEKKKQTQTTEKPYFGLLGTELKTTPRDQITFQVKNMGNHAAINLSNRVIMIDQQLQIEPTVFDWSEGNEIPPDIPHFFTAYLQLPPIEVPAYVIFAIRYQDKEASLTKPMCQIWYLKWAGTENGILSTNFTHASIVERDNILNHLRDKLKDYLK